ncbi:hypothetical protein [Streptomyces lydicus]|uniref:hypothetical protein n=1 Tax=Streptomyces lydicus TaxID=47763 RepID=UPI0013E9973E|nr:hypothetical protein [Streptomyces lydicus]
MITRRLAVLAHSGLQALDEPTVRAVVRQAVRDVRTAPPPAPVESPADPRHRAPSSTTWLRARISSGS